VSTRGGKKSKRTIKKAPEMGEKVDEKKKRKKEEKREDQYKKRDKF